MKHFKAFKAAAFFLAALLSFSCNTEIIDPGVDPVVNPETPTSKYVTIPVLFNLSAGINTKVTLNSSDKYTFVDGDVVYFKNDTYEISGYVVYDSAHVTGPWEGRMKYNGANDFDSVIKTAPLNAVLVGSGSPLLATTYDSDLAHAFPTDLDSPDYSTAVAADLSTAVQNFSYFTTSFTYAQATTSGGSSNSIALQQQSCFIVFSLSFFGNSQLNIPSSSGTTITIIDGETTHATGNVAIESGVSSFAVAFKGGSTSLSEPKVTICNKVISFNGASLGINKKYTVTRTIYPSVGDAFYSDGIWGTYGHDNEAIAKGVVVYINKGENSLHPTSKKGNVTVDATVFADGVTEKDGDSFGHGLVMALTDTNEGLVRWGGDQSVFIIADDTFSAKWSTWTGVNNSSHHLLIKDFKGKTKTAYLYNNEGFIAGPSAYNYGALIPKTTGWFLPSSAQWIAAFISQGVTTDFLPDDSWNTFSRYWTDGSLDYGENGTYAKMNEMINAISGGISLVDEAWYWSSSQCDEKRALSVGFKTNDGIAFSNSNKMDNSYLRRVRPFLAF